MNEADQICQQQDRADLENVMKMQQEGEDCLFQAKQEQQQATTQMFLQLMGTNECFVSCTSTAPTCLPLDSYSSNDAPKYLAHDPATQPTTIQDTPTHPTSTINHQATYPRGHPMFLESRAGVGLIFSPGVSYRRPDHLSSRLTILRYVIKTSEYKSAIVHCSLQPCNSLYV